MTAAQSRALGLAAIATALITLAIISVLTYQDWKRYGMARANTLTDQRILSLNGSILDDLRDAETGQRGFLLTGRAEYLEPYRAALDRLPNETRELGVLTGNDPDQHRRFARLQPLIAKKLEELRTTIELRQSQQPDAALALMISSQGKQTMDQIRRVSQEIEDAETARSNAAWQDLESWTQQLRLVMLFGGVLMAALVGIGGLALTNASDKTVRLAVQLSQSKRATDETHDMMRAALYSIGDAVITTDREGAVQIMNSVAESLTGYRESDARGAGIERIIRIVNHDTRETVENPVRQVIKDGKVVALANHTVLISRSGAEVPIDDSAAPITSASGELTGVVLVFRDVSERKKAFDIARRLAAIVEDSDDAIVAESLDGTITAWNRGAERLFGYSAEEIVGAPISRIIPPDRLDEMRIILERIGRGDAVDHSETERIAKDGRRIRVSITISPIRDDAGRVVGASKIARDVTRQTQLEELVRQTQKMEAVGRLAGGLAHDFNNLLTVILGYAVAIKNRISPEDPLHNTVNEILTAGERAASLTGQLLAFSRKQVIQPQIVDLNLFVSGTRNMLERLLGEDVDLAAVLDPEPCFVNMDTGQLTQILMNLAVNSRDAMPTGGKLTIETRTVVREREDLGRRGIRPAGAYAVLAVSDTGVGMSPETEAHIFEPFFTTKEPGKGTGLGLATVYGIVTQNSGWVDFYTEPNHGTTFRIYLPRVPAPIEAETPQSKEVTQPSPAATILLVEDQAAIRMLAEDVLADAGHRVLSASNGRSGLELAQKHRDTIDLLITDVVMPEMSGPDLADQLTKLRPGLIVLFVSGYTDHALLHRGSIEQGTAFLQKPFLPEQLVAKVSQLLRENVPHAPARVASPALGARGSPSTGGREGD
ncbi:MAG TPA: PAS domain S-box protein [Bryobacteraceae bacterium]|nr:PAS domain S-box protein [Bryobacteraceae bacterium]